MEEKESEVARKDGLAADAPAPAQHATSPTTTSRRLARRRSRHLSPTVRSLSPAKPTKAAHSGATEIAQKSISYAEQNVEATFDFAQKLMKAKDGAEVVGLQSEFLSRQMQALSTQVQELGQSAAKIVVDAAKPKT